jgi:hypothetical protein
MNLLLKKILMNQNLRAGVFAIVQLINEKANHRRANLQGTKKNATLHCSARFFFTPCPPLTSHTNPPPGGDI